ncbi:flagellar basal body L-ring protein FlgH [Parasulfitobacter algicola]|uniref:Flagellar L-ring protein n=1 Tax=Parasulfitobacter algicola TaxID=2614809 RepID=A0ABX2IP61_9RHOB|nr:flagellar basal body L-ring protein FlgH [Sulfitobacter algicola]NSX54672.1 flagellar basal body L-ring protein FlgH [Sulfitobacter algicola]
MKKLPVLAILCLTGACTGIDTIGREPKFTPPEESRERRAMLTPSLPQVQEPNRNIDNASLWSAQKQSLLGDRRAVQRGDIMTVVIEIDDRAEISNSTDRSRNGSESLSVPSLFGIPQRIEPKLPVGATLSDAVRVDSSSSSAGDGSVRRREKLTLRVAATIVDVLPNGVLSIQGVQQVRVNFELRELLVSGYVRPEDISRLNEITYDKIASAQISYGGRGHISDMQQPRYGQQIVDKVLPF